jgi:hypothetical protein
MKNRSFLSQHPFRTVTGWLLIAVFCALGSLGGGACSSNAPPTFSPSENPSAEPFAAPAPGVGEQNDDPEATETNFITLVCVSDADCRGEDRCVFAPQPDAGAAASGDAGVRLGRCKVSAP